MSAKNKTKYKTALSKLVKEFSAKSKPAAAPKRQRKTVAGLNIENIERAKKELDAKKKEEEGKMNNGSNSGLRRSTRTRKAVVKFNEEAIQKEKAAKKEALKKAKTKKNTVKQEIKQEPPSVLNVKKEEPISIIPPPISIIPPPITIVPEEVTVGPGTAPTTATTTPIANENNANYGNLIERMKAMHINKRRLHRKEVESEKKIKHVVESTMKDLDKSVKKDHYAKWRIQDLKERAKKKYAKTLKSMRNAKVATMRAKSAKFHRTAPKVQYNNMNNIMAKMNVMDINDL